MSKIDIDLAKALAKLTPEQIQATLAQANTLEADKEKLKGAIKDAKKKLADLEDKLSKLEGKPASKASKGKRTKKADILTPVQVVEVLKSKLSKGVDYSISELINLTGLNNPSWTKFWKGEKNSATTIIMKGSRANAVYSLK